MTKLCDFGKEIKKRLIDIDKNQEWLISEVQKDTDLYFDSSYMHKILIGKLSTPSIVSSIRKILDLRDEDQKAG